MTTETIIMTSIARRLEAGTYLPSAPRRVYHAPVVAPERASLASYAGACLCGLLLGLAYLVQP